MLRRQSKVNAVMKRSTIDSLVASCMRLLSNAMLVYPIITCHSSMARRSVHPVKKNKNISHHLHVHILISATVTADIILPFNNHRHQPLDSPDFARIFPANDQQTSRCQI